jgi:hypothetical protein
MSDHLTHLTPADIHRIITLAGGARDQLIQNLTAGKQGLLSDDIEGSNDLYGALELILLKDQTAYAELLVTMYVGRGHVAPRDFAEQVKEYTRSNHDPDYIVNKAPVLAKHLITGLWALGYQATPKESWVEEYRLERELDNDPDYPPAPRPASLPPCVTVEEFGDNSEPLKHLSIGDVFDLLAQYSASDDAKNRIEMDMIAGRVERGLSRFPNSLEPDFAQWHRDMDAEPRIKGYEDTIEQLSLPARVELISLFHYGEGKRKGTWEDVIRRNVGFYNNDPDTRMDLATICAHSRPFPEHVVNGLRRLGLIASAAVKRQTKTAEG